MANPPRVGVGSYILKDGRVLLGYRTTGHASGVWSAPGGHIEHRESPADAAAREAEELRSDIREIVDEVVEVKLSRFKVMINEDLTATNDRIDRVERRLSKQIQQNSRDIQETNHLLKTHITDSQTHRIA
jgi:hypothetical protein